jgi:peptide/nickel transport system substrate-binding protein
VEDSRRWDAGAVRSSVAALGMGAALALLACAGPAERPGERWSGRPAATVVIATTADIEGINPLITQPSDINSDIHRLLFRELARERADFKSGPPTFEPDLAESWEFSEDGLELTFHLREGLSWSDGVPLTAADVRWTWQAQIDPEVLWSYRDKKSHIENVEVVGPRTARFRFSDAYPDQLADAVEGVILPSHRWSERPFAEFRSDAGWFLDRLVSSGPFLLERWAPQQEIVLARNESFYRSGHPKLDRAVFRVVTDKTAQLNLLLGGEIDYVQQMTPDQTVRLENAAEIEIESFWGRQFNYLCWNTTHRWFGESDVRRALTLAIDRQEIIDTLYRGYARRSIGPILSSVWAFNERVEPWPFDPKVARLVLAKHGFVDSDGDGWLDLEGERFTFELLANSGNRILLDTGTMIQEQLRRVGVQVEIRALEFQTYVERLTGHQIEAALGGWNVDTSLDLAFAFHSASIEGGLNFGSYSSPEVDRLIEEANRAADREAKQAHLERLQEILHEEQPYTFLLEPKRINARHLRVHGTQPNALSSYENLEEWWVEGGGAETAR